MTLRILDGGKHSTTSNGTLEANRPTLNTYRPVSEIPIQWKGPARLNERLLMLDIPVFYATRGEHTKRVAEFIANAIWQRGYVARAIDIRHVDDARLSRAQAVVLGGSLQNGRGPRQIARFVKRRRDSLQRIPSAFFSVSEEAASQDREKKQQAIDNIDSFLARVPWRPELRASFGAASPRTEGVWPSRILRRVLTKQSRQSTSTSVAPDLTNWSTVTDFAHTLVHTAEERLRSRVADA